MRKPMHISGIASSYLMKRNKPVKTVRRESHTVIKKHVLGLRLIEITADNARQVFLLTSTRPFMCSLSSQLCLWSSDWVTFYEMAETEDFVLCFIAKGSRMHINWSASPFISLMMSNIWKARRLHMYKTQVRAEVLLLFSVELSSV